MFRTLTSPASSSNLEEKKPQKTNAASANSSTRSLPVTRTSLPKNQRMISSHFPAATSFTSPASRVSKATRIGCAAQSALLFLAKWSEINLPATWTGWWINLCIALATKQLAPLWSTTACFQAREAAFLFQALTGLHICQTTKRATKCCSCCRRHLSAN